MIELPNDHWCANGYAPRLNLAIGIATTGRRDILQAVLPYLAAQTRAPDAIVICVAADTDIDKSTVLRLDLPIRIIKAERGLCRQRNAIISSVPDADVLLFLDDDFLLTPNYLMEVERVFLDAPDVVVCTGTVEADGITGPGIPVSEGVRIIDVASRGPGSSPSMMPIYNAYGCNMALRMRIVRHVGLKFDENLPLYGWLEDVDFSRQMARFGKIVRSGALRGVHLGTKRGRTSGIKLGYSQIANPLYLMRKRTMSARHAGVQIFRNVVANLVKAAQPESWVDRRGRLRGNLRAFVDLLRGRLAPQNILTLE
ncbi:glycosyltransferase [Pseudaminobacter arsenicus]|uniref:Glycosyltransferase n=1 Tax=Borborobacter arsenicus TaxID=1851146 RepID=A0A432VBM3_9HYPH|nr:glycosyltransferase [Pseudaminobacter arsenicus]RUM99571.1 glycosyltransferase [Pseudaminobacter arsenicus]